MSFNNNTDNMFKGIEISDSDSDTEKEMNMTMTMLPMKNNRKVEARKVKKSKKNRPVDLTKLFFSDNVNLEVGTIVALPASICIRCARGGAVHAEN